MSPKKKSKTPGVEHIVLPPELVHFMYSKAGMRKALRIVEFLSLWGVLADELGREPTRQEFLDYWDESPATYFRRLEQWRMVWPDDKSPQRVWEWRLTQLPNPGDLPGMAPA